MFNPVSYVINLIVSIKKLYSILMRGDIEQRLLEAEKIIEELDLIAYDNSARLSKLEKLNNEVKENTRAKTANAGTQTPDNIAAEFTFKGKAAAKKKYKTRFTPYRSAKNRALVAFRVQSASV